MEVKKISCPICDGKFELNPDLEVGDKTYCPACYADLKITKLNPPQVEQEDESLNDYEEEEPQDDFSDNYE